MLALIVLAATAALTSGAPLAQQPCDSAPFATINIINDQTGRFEIVRVCKAGEAVPLQQLITSGAASSMLLSGGFTNKPVCTLVGSAVAATLDAKGASFVRLAGFAGELLRVVDVSDAVITCEHAVATVV